MRPLLSLAQRGTSSAQMSEVYGADGLSFRTPWEYKVSPGLGDLRPSRLEAISDLPTHCPTVPASHCRLWAAQGDPGRQRHHHPVHLAGLDLLLHDPTVPAAALSLHRQGAHPPIRQPHLLPALLPVRCRRHCPAVARLPTQRERPPAPALLQQCMLAEPGRRPCCLAAEVAIMQLLYTTLESWHWEGA